MSDYILPKMKAGDTLPLVARKVGELFVLTEGFGAGVYRALARDPAIWVLVGQAPDQVLYPKWNDLLGVVVLDASIAQRVPIVAGVDSKRTVTINIVSVLLSGDPVQWDALDHKYQVQIRLTPFNVAEVAARETSAYKLGTNQIYTAGLDWGDNTVLQFDAVLPIGRGLSVGLVDNTLAPGSQEVALPVVGMVQVGISGFRV